MTTGYVPLPLLAGKITRGAAVPVLAHGAPSSAQLLGTVHARRGRWNPFLPDNDMTVSEGRFHREFFLSRDGGRHGDGVYAFRFVLDHDLRKTYKADHARRDANGKPSLVHGDAADQAQNVMIRVEQDGVYRISFDPSAGTFDVSPKPIWLTEIHSVQINGFVWDSEELFQKFDETRPSHDMTRDGKGWRITLSLRADGGISTRKDGVYQLLFSANHNEDWGFAAVNDGRGRTAGGTGFASSGGRSVHSAIAIRVFEDGDYTFRLFPEEGTFSVTPEGGKRAPALLNDRKSIQLLGTIWKDKPYDPTAPEREMEPAEAGKFVKVVSIDPGIYAVNFAIDRELFLDTMALGAWIVPDTPGRLVGRAWHGKPNEPNVFFEVVKGGSYRFTYDIEADELVIEPEEATGEEALRALPVLEVLQLVGSFDANAWDPTAPGNDMDRVGDSAFSKVVYLEAGRKYQYKYVANRWGWLWVFADYELDGYGADFTGRNPCPRRSRLQDLKRYGQLTTHGDPPPLELTPTVTGHFTFIADLETGGYSVELLRAAAKRNSAMSKLHVDQGSFVDAIRANSVAFVERALAEGMSPNYKDPAGYTPLMIAAGLSRAHLVRSLLKAHADPNVIDDGTGNSALHFCAMGGSAEVARLLIGRGAFINLQNPSQGHTPLIDAVIYKSPKVVAVLLEAGANIQIKNNWGHSAEDFIADLLKQPGTEKERINAVSAAFEARRAADARKKAEMRLFQAVLDGNASAVEECIRNGDDLNQVYPVEQTGNDGHTPLLAAARDGQGEICQLLLEAGADPYIPDYLYKAFPIFKSAYMGKLNTAKVQVEHGVDIHVQGPWNGYTPLHDALWQGHPDIAELLVRAGADVTLRALDGRTPLDIAVETYGANAPITVLLRSRTSE
ncbi:ankyrin repeat domain-containing protein [Sorangium sp. So ce134]